MSTRSSGSTTRMGVVQMTCGLDRAANVDKAESMIRQAAGAGAGLVCLPELFATRYFCQTQNTRFFDWAEPVPGPTVERLAGLAADLDVVLVLSLFERRAPGVYHNTVAVLDGSRGYVGKYRKMHIPHDPRYEEKFYFTPGDLGFTCFDTSRGRVAPLICWDQWYPEAARLAVLHGAEILLCPTAIGWHPQEKQELGETQHEAWELVQRSHAVCNGCFVAAVNRTGFEPEPGADATGGDRGIEFWGQSFVAGPDGAVIARAGVAEETVLVAELELGRIEELRTGWPFLRDRRIDAYDGLLRRFGSGND